MKLPRWAQVLIGVAGVLLFLLGISFWRLASHSPVPYAKANRAVGIHLAQGAVSIQLDRKNMAWEVMTSSGPKPADGDKVKSLLSSLTDVTLDDVISERSDHNADFEITPASGTRVSLLDAQGKPFIDGIFGKQAPDFSHIYFRFSDRPQVYLASGIFRGEVEPGSPDRWVKIETSTSTSHPR
jgi:hypothetical protein